MCHYLNIFFITVHISSHERLKAWLPRLRQAELEVRGLYIHPPKLHTAEFECLAAWDVKFRQ